MQEIVHEYHCGSLFARRNKKQEELLPREILFKLYAYLYIKLFLLHRSKPKIKNYSEGTVLLVCNHLQRKKKKKKDNEQKKLFLSADLRILRLNSQKRTKCNEWQIKKSCRAT